MKKIISSVSQRSRTLRNLFLAVVVFGMFAAGQLAYASTITVNNNTELGVVGDGNCELDEAIRNANFDSDVTGGDCVSGSGTDTIVFSGSISFVPTTSLTTVTSPIIFDGTSGGTTGTCSTRSLGVTIDGTNIPGVWLNFSGPAASGSAVKGFVVYWQTSGSAVAVNGLSDFTMSCMMLGTDPTGTVARPNFGQAVYIQNSSNVTIGGTNPGDGNLFTAATSEALHFDNVSNATVQGNWFGLDITGDEILDTHSNQFTITNSSSLTIGGSTSAARNVFSGAQNTNYGSAIYLEDTSSDITIQGNYFGTNSSGTAVFTEPTGYQTDLLDICTSLSCGGANGSITNLIVGGSNPGEGNLFAGNRYTAMSIDGNIDNVTIQGNTVGLNAAGTAAIGNLTGISFRIQGEEDVSSVDGLVIGGSGSAGNVFANTGVTDNVLRVDLATDVTIKGNKFGVFPDGVTASSIANDSPMLAVTSSSDVIIGGTGDERNMFATASDNGMSAYFMMLRALDTASITGNYFGVTSDGTTPLGAVGGSSGIITIGLSSDVVIGGDTPAEGNILKNVAAGFRLIGNQGFPIIKNNTIVATEQGLLIYDIPGFFPWSGGGATILQNSIVADGQGIDLATDSNLDLAPDLNLGYSSNDSGDADTGPNDYLNRPVLISAAQNNTDVDITFMLDVPVTGFPYHVEFFSGGVNINGFGNGETYEGSVNVTVSTSGPHVFQTTVTGADATQGITATVTPCTDVGCTTYGGTSEFSNGIVSVAGGIDVGSTADLQTYLEANGPYHIYQTGIYLGTGATLDTLSAVVEAGGEGVTSDATTYLPSASATISVTVDGSSGYYAAWFDENNDDTFDDATEEVAGPTAINNETQTFTLTIPATVGSYQLRVRYYATDPGLDPEPTGEAIGGEVEDLTIVVFRPSTGGGIVPVNKVCNDPKAVNYTNGAGIGDLATCVYASIVTTTPATTPSVTGINTYAFKRPLKQGMRGDDVKKLQEYLNTHGFQIAASGPGSPGNETTYFGALTTKALIKFQEANKDAVLKPFGLTKGTGYFGTKTIEFISR